MEGTEAYAESYATPQNELLQQILDDTLANHPSSNMISGHVQGRFLSMLSHMIRPLRILEIGTFTGFSALCLAEGLADNGLLYTIELRDKDADTAEAYFKQSTLHGCIKLLRGNAAEIIPRLNENWDLVFIDADKTGYIQYYEQVLPRVKTGGFIIADNVLFHGEVLKFPLKGKNAIAIDAFNRHVQSDERVEQMMLTLRDGLMLIRKK